MATMDDLNNVFQTFSNQMTGISAEMTKITNGIGTLGSALIVPPFTGNPKDFHNWIKSIEKQALLENLADEEKKKLTFRSSREGVSDFIQRFIRDHPDENFDRLKQELNIRFGEVTDQMHAFTLLRNVRQKTDENVQMYAERLLVLGNTSFPVGTDAQTIERQLIGFFVDGLSSDFLKMKLIRDAPATYTNAVNIALQEQNLRKRFDLRTGGGRHFENRERHDLPMEIDHMRFNRRPRDQSHGNGNHRQHTNNQSHGNGTHRQQTGNRSYGPPQGNNNFRRPHVNAVTHDHTHEQRTPFRCYNCGKLGHIARFCKSPRQQYQQQHQPQHQGN